jgi:hypothetical protein
MRCSIREDDRLEAVPPKIIRASRGEGVFAAAIFTPRSANPPSAARREINGRRRGAHPDSWFVLARERPAYFLSKRTIPPPGAKICGTQRLP